MELKGENGTCTVIHYVFTGRLLGKDLISFYEFLTAPAAKILDGWFESEPLKATLATDAVIGAMLSPKLPGSALVAFLSFSLGNCVDQGFPTWGAHQGIF